MKRRIRTLVSLIVLFLGVGFLAPLHATKAPETLDGFLEELGDSPEKILESVRKMVSFSPYSGYLKGPLGVCWDKKANSADAADLIISALQRRNIEARLAYGQLNDEQVTTLLKTAFPVASFPPQVQEKLPGDKGYDPVKDESLRAALSTHVWAQAKTGEKWIDLDPFLRGSGAQTPAVEVVMTKPAPSNEERRSMKIEVFSKTDLPDEAAPFVFEKPLSELVGKRLSFLNQGVSSSSRSIRGQIQRLRPIVVLDDEILQGEPYGGERYDDRIPPAADRLKGVFDNLEGPSAPKDGGGKEVAVQEIYMDISLFGADLPERKQRRYLYISGPDGIDRLDDLTSFGIVFGEPPEGFLKDLAKSAASAATPLPDLRLPDSGPFAPGLEEKAESILKSSILMTSTISYWIGACSHRMTRDLDGAFGTVSTCDDGRIIGVSVHGKPFRLSTDLVFDSVNAIPNQGAKRSASHAMAGMRGLFESWIEGACINVVSKATGNSDQVLIDVGSVFQSASEQGIKIVGIVPPSEESLPEGRPDEVSAGKAEAKKNGLDKVVLSSLGKRIFMENLKEGMFFLIPEKPVEIQGRKISAWYEIDRKTGSWVGVLDDGRNESIVEYREMQRIVGLATTWTAGFWSGFINTLFSFNNAVMEVVAGDPEQSWKLVRTAGMVSARFLDINNNLLQAFGDVEGLLILGGTDPGTTMLLGQHGLMLGQVAGVKFLETVMPR